MDLVGKCGYIEVTKKKGTKIKTLHWELLHQHEFYKL